MAVRDRERRARARQRGFMSVGDLLGAAVAGGFLAYVGAQSFFLGDAVGARSEAESAARELAGRSAADACAAVDLGETVGRRRFEARLDFRVDASPPDVGALLTSVLALGPESSATELLAVLFRSDMLVAKLDVSSLVTRGHDANMFGRPGGTFLGRAHRSAPCLQVKLPSDADLGKNLAKGFFGTLPFGTLR